MPKSCTVLTGLWFLVYLVIALDLHCLPSVHFLHTPSVCCLLHSGLPKNSQHCNCAEAAAWFYLLLVVLCSAIWRLVWAQRPRYCALSWQLAAVVYSLDYTRWPTFPTSCTHKLLIVFVLRIPPNSSLNDVPQMPGDGPESQWCIYPAWLYSMSTSISLSFWSVLKASGKIYFLSAWNL